MTINPFYILVTTYLIFSIFSFVSGLGNHGFYLLGEFYYVSFHSYILAFTIDCIFIILLTMAYTKWIRFSSARFFKIELCKLWGLFIILHIVFYIVFVLSTGAGIAGSGFSFGGFNFFNYYFIALSPDLIAFIILPFLKSDRQFIFGLLLLTFSFLLRGWLAGLIYFFILITTRLYPLQLKGKNVFLWSLGGLTMLALLPLLEGIKWGRRLGMSFVEIVNFAFEKFSLEAYTSVFESTANRFSHLNHSALVFEHSGFFFDSYLSGAYKSYWQNGIFYDTFCRLFDNCGVDLNTFIVQNLLDPFGKDWNADIGIAGWIAATNLFSVFFVFFLIIIFYFFKTYILKPLGAKGLNIFFSFSMIYLFHAWFSPFFNLFFYLIVFSIVVRIKTLREPDGCRLSNSAIPLPETSSVQAKIRDV